MRTELGVNGAEQIKYMIACQRGDFRLDFPQGRVLGTDNSKSLGQWNYIAERRVYMSSLGVSKDVKP